MLNINDKHWYDGDDYVKPVPSDGFHYEVVEKKEKDKPVIYLIGNAIGSTIEVIPENVYLDDDEAEEDMDMKEFMENASEA